MKPAELEKTNIKISNSNGAEIFFASGEVIKFDGFLKLYQVSKDNDNDENDGILPWKDEIDFFNIFFTADEEKSALDVWKDALSNVMPHVEVRSRRVGGATFQIPSPIRSDRKISIAMKWLINYSRKRNEKSMAQKLAAEVLAAAKEEGAAVKKKVDTHKMAEANKAFSHFRF